MGHVVKHGWHLSGEWGYLAGRDTDRLVGLNDAFHDPGVRATFTTGGEAAYRITDGIDTTAAGSIRNR